MQTKLRFENICEEPFRVFFPLGLAAGLIGVGLWPLFYNGMYPAYPGLAHARVMVEGFMGAFIIGFLGTAMPRMLSAPSLSRGEFTALLLLYLGTAGAHLGNFTALGDGFFLALTAVFSSALTWRFVNRKDMPPPSMLLAFMALLCAIAGSALRVAAHCVAIPLSLDRLSGILINHGFLLLPVLGVGAFMFPRFLQAPNRHDLPESKRPGGKWLHRATRASMAGGFLIATFVAEAHGFQTISYGLRFLIVSWYLLGELPVFKVPPLRGSPALALCVGLFCLPAGLVSLALLPAYTKGLEHVVFITGYGLIAICVATWVIHGHSGEIDKMRRRYLPILIVTAAFLIAMASRVTADFFLRIQASHYLYAAEFWIGGALIWGVSVLPKVLRSED